MTKECWSIFKKKVEVKVETQQCSWIGDKSERHHLNIIPSRPYLDRFFRIVKSVQTERGSINYILHVMADGWRILIHVSTLNIYKYLWSRRYGSSSCVELSNSVKRNCIYRNWKAWDFVQHLYHWLNMMVGILKKTFISVFTAPNIQTVHTSYLLCFL